MMTTEEMETQLVAVTARLERLEELVAKRKARRRPVAAVQADALELTDALRTLMDHIWKVWPERDMPQVFVPSRRAVAEALGRGATAAQLSQAAERYAAHCAQQGTEPRYVMTIRRFYENDETWQRFVEVTVYGLTRQQWIASGQDVARFDALMRGQETK